MCVCVCVRVRERVVLTVDETFFLHINNLDPVCFDRSRVNGAGTDSLYRFIIVCFIREKNQNDEMC